MADAASPRRLAPDPRFAALAHTPAQQALAALVGQPGSRWRIPTPALVLDLDAAHANLQRMALRARAAGLALRPHAKSHKCAQIARWQLDAGAVGQCCAKLGEAEALAEAGIGQGPGGGSLLLTSPVVGADAAARLAALRCRGVAVAVALDHPEQALALQAACQALGMGLAALPSAAPDRPGPPAAGPGLRLDVLVDVDVGLQRTGVANASAARALADTVAACPALRLAGVQGYGGHWQHIVGAQARGEAVAQGLARLGTVVQALRGAGHAVPWVTGGGTGSFAADARAGVLTEVQPGSYVFMDRQYRDALGDDDDGAFAQSLWVQARVVSTNAADHVTVDAGLKALATDGPLPLAGPGRFAGCAYQFFGDEHGRLARPRLAPADAPVALGERVELVPPHCDPTVDRHSQLVLVRGDTVVGVTPLQAARQAQ